jgi:hypothetical protein
MLAEDFRPAAARASRIVPPPGRHLPGWIDSDTRIASDGVSDARLTRRNGRLLRKNDAGRVSHVAQL